jgi:hypothetical protein
MPRLLSLVFLLLVTPVTASVTTCPSTSTDPCCNITPGKDWAGLQDASAFLAMISDVHSCSLSPCTSCKAQSAVDKFVPLMAQHGCFGGAVKASASDIHDISIGSAYEFTTAIHTATCTVNCTALPNQSQATCAPIPSGSVCSHQTVARVLLTALVVICSATLAMQF